MINSPTLIQIIKAISNNFRMLFRATHLRSILMALKGEMFIGVDFDIQALRVSMEEQRQRQEEEARRAAAQSAAEAGVPTATADGKHVWMFEILKDGGGHSGSGQIIFINKSLTNIL